MLKMSNTQESFFDLSNIVVNEVEIETTDDTLANNAISKELHIFEPNDYHNGAIFDDLNYCWSQTFTEIGKI